MSSLTHLDDQGSAHMVDVGDKAITERIAVAAAAVSMQAATFSLLQQGAHKKGDVLPSRALRAFRLRKSAPTLFRYVIR